MTTLTKSNTSWLGGIVAAEYVLRLVPKGTHDWDLFISPESLQKIFEKCKYFCTFLRSNMKSLRIGLCLN